MLTADHVLARRRGDRLTVTSLDRNRRAQAVQMAADLIAIAQGHVGADRQTFLEACGAVTAAPRDRKIVAGLQKLVLDRCHFEEDTPLDPPTVRDTVFALATQARRAAAGHGFDRDAVLATAAAELDSDPETVDAALFAEARDDIVGRTQKRFEVDGLTSAKLLEELSVGLEDASARRLRNSQ